MVEKYADNAHSVEMVLGDETVPGADVAGSRSWERRNLFRGAAVLAGAAGVAALGAVNPAAADAADGDAVRVGGTYQGSTTSFTGLGEDAALELSCGDGPALRFGLLDLGWPGELQPGEFAAEMAGPLVGVDYGFGAVTTSLVTGLELDATPVPMAVTPQRLLDTRRASGRKLILRSSSASALDARGRLVAGSWIDVGVAPDDKSQVLLSEAFLNVTAVLPSGNGYLTVYYPGAGTRPGVSSLNATAGLTMANAVFVHLGQVYEDYYIVRIYTSTTTHVLLDLSGVVSALNPIGANAGTTHKTDALSAAGARRLDRQAKRAAALKKSLG